MNRTEIKNSIRNGRWLLVVLMFLAFSCDSGDTENNPPRSDANSNANKEVVSEFEKELKGMRTADFDFIYTIQRKDKEKLESDDKKFIKTKTYPANRYSVTRDEKIVFVGTNYKVDDKYLEELKERFDFEDFSKSPEELKKASESSGNTNTNNKK